MAKHAPPQDADTPEDGDGASSPLITSRFLFVDVAAQRAKQLRRGALPRIDRSPGTPHKLERVAMEEVRRGVVEYALPTVEDVAKGRGRE